MFSIILFAIVISGFLFILGIKTAFAKKLLFASVFLAFGLPLILGVVNGMTGPLASLLTLLLDNLWWIFPLGLFASWGWLKLRTGIALRPQKKANQTQMAFRDRALEARRVPILPPRDESDRMNWH